MENLKNREGQKDFFIDMEEHQTTSNEFFNPFMLDSLERNFGLSRVMIMYFDTHGRFLSWVDKNGRAAEGEDHPYNTFFANDIVRYKVYEDAVRDHLTYFDIKPRLYRASDIVVDYENSSLVSFLESQFGAHYSLTMAFGINAYIQVVFLRDSSEGDFSEEDVQYLRDIYTYIAMAYKSFKKYEQARIISNIHGEIIASGEKAYFITDDFMHILDSSKEAIKRIEDLLGSGIGDTINADTPCTWLPFLLGLGDEDGSDDVHNRTIKNYIYTIHDYKQQYSNGIVDLYHWITIHEKEEHPASYIKETDDLAGDLSMLTKTEVKVAKLMAKGYTYKEIAASLVISYHTVKKHVENIYSKCHVNSRYQLLQLIKKSV